MHIIIKVICLAFVAFVSVPCEVKPLLGPGDQWNSRRGIEFIYRSGMYLVMVNTWQGLSDSIEFSD